MNKSEHYKYAYRDSGKRTPNYRILSEKFHEIAVSLAEIESDLEDLQETQDEKILDVLCKIEVLADQLRSLRS